MAKTHDEKTSTKILKFIDEYIRKEKWAPSVREIGKAVYLSSTSTVFAHLERLANAGLIEKQAGSPRALRVTKKGMRFLESNKEV